MQYMETISIRVEKDLVQDIEKAMKRHRYATKTEFIRESLRKNIRDLEKEEALLRLEQVYGSSKRKTTDVELHRTREKAFHTMARKLGVD